SMSRPSSCSLGPSSIVTCNGSAWRRLPCFWSYWRLGSSWGTRKVVSSGAKKASPTGAFVSIGCWYFVIPSPTSAFRPHPPPPHPSALDDDARSAPHRTGRYRSRYFGRSRQHWRWGAHDIGFFRRLLARGIGGRPAHLHYDAGEAVLPHQHHAEHSLAVSGPH